MSWLRAGGMAVKAFKQITKLFFLIFLPLMPLSLHSASDPYFRTEKKHFKKINQRTKGEKRGMRFVLVHTAASASIRKHPKIEGRYQLILEDISPYIQFYKSQPSKSFGLIFMKQYLWFCKIGKSAFLKCKRGALGYISFSENGEQSAEVLELLSPEYQKKENRIVYDITEVDAFKISESKMKKVTLIIDLALN